MKRLITLIALCMGLLFAGPAWAGVNVNSASQSELETLPGIGPSKASAIIEYRNANGPFSSLSQLDAVPGIGPATLSNIGPMVEFGEGGQAAAGSDAPAETPTEAPPAEEPAPSSSGAVNINTASASQLQSLPGIGASKAAAIVDDRNANGAFGSCSDLQRVTGIGPATVATIGSACTVN